MPVAYSVLADVVVVVHFGFIAFVALGGFLAWRWPRLVWSHVAAVTWAAGIVIVGYDCPLTPAEKHLRRLAGEGGYTDGFVDRYIEGVIYPERYTSLVRLAIAAAVLVAWTGLAMVHRRRDGGTGRRAFEERHGVLSKAERLRLLGGTSAASGERAGGHVRPR